MKQIFLENKNFFALVDDEDYEYLNKWKWMVYSSKNDNIHYAVRTTSLGKKTTVRMHRVIMNVNDRTVLIDHKDHNGLNNQKSNLRICNNSENGANSLKNKNKSSRYLGVGWSKREQKWRARINPNRKEIHLGYFVNEEDAARAYDTGAIKHFGQFASLNFKS